MGDMKSGAKKKNGMVGGRQKAKKKNGMMVGRRRKKRKMRMKEARAGSGINWLGAG
jgi:hypothetical protein